MPDTLEFSCQCGVIQTTPLHICPQCDTHLCDECMPHGSAVPCVDCMDPFEAREDFDEDLDFDPEN